MDLEVVGRIPAGLHGVFYRNGPNPQFEPRDDYHWFSGDGMIHGFFVEDGKVRYRNRYVRTPKWRAGARRWTRVVRRLRQSASGRPVGRWPGWRRRQHQHRLARRPAAGAGGGPRPTRWTPQTLETLGYVDAYRGKVTAHPKLDPETGEMVWFAYCVGAGR